MENYMQMIELGILASPFVYAGIRSYVKNKHLRRDVVQLRKRLSAQMDRFDYELVALDSSVENDFGVAINKLEDTLKDAHFA